MCTIMTCVTKVAEEENQDALGEFGNISATTFH